jgi:hypothetical protein
MGSSFDEFLHIIIYQFYNNINIAQLSFFFVEKLLRAYCGDSFEYYVHLEIPVNSLMLPF